MGKIYNAGQRGTWTPTITFATPGDLNAVYSTQLGEWYLQDGVVTLFFYVIATTFTHTTASGNLQISGLPFTSKTAGSMQWAGSFSHFRGLTKASYTEFNPVQTSTSSSLIVVASGSAVTEATLTSADVPTGAVKVFCGRIKYPVA